MPSSKRGSLGAMELGFWGARNGGGGGVYRGQRGDEFVPRTASIRSRDRICLADGKITLEVEDAGWGPPVSEVREERGLFLGCSWAEA